MNNLQGIPEFVKVAETGSFTAAAKEMNVSKSHISKQVKMLEDHLGVVLILRTTRAVSLTNQGVDFYRRCEKILQNLDEACSALADDLTRPRGHIRLTAAGAFGDDLLAPVLASFLRRYPDVSIEMAFTNREVDLQAEHFDLAIRSGYSDLSRYQSEELYSYPLKTLASKRYLNTYGYPEKPTDLYNHNCLMGTLPYWRFMIENQIREIVPRGNWQSNNGRALKRAAEQDIGIIQLPSFYIHNPTDLEEILEPYTVKNVQVWGVYPRTQYVPHRIRLLLDYIRQTLSG